MRLLFSYSYESISAGLPHGNESSNFYCYQVVYRIKIVPINLPTDNFYDKIAVFDKISDNRHTDRPYKTPLYFIMSICITCYSIIRDESFVIETWQWHFIELITSQLMSFASDGLHFVIFWTVCFCSLYVEYPFL